MMIMLMNMYIYLLGENIQEIKDGRVYGSDCEVDGLY